MIYCQLVHSEDRVNWRLFLTNKGHQVHVRGKVNVVCGARRPAAVPYPWRQLCLLGNKRERNNAGVLDISEPKLIEVPVSVNRAEASLHSQYYHA